MNRIDVLNHTNQSDQNSLATTNDIDAVLAKLATPEEAGKESPFKDLQTITQVVASSLLAIHKTLTDLDTRVAKLQASFEESANRKEWYSVPEAAKELGKSEFTVREWCRLDRVNAHKRESGRSAKREWMISHQELEHFRFECSVDLEF
jgi:Helix-turn-helix domain